MLYGREAECALIEQLLGGARESRSGVLVIRGVAGVGKSALLELARERATEMHVLGCRGVESEAELPFAAVHQLVRPVLDLVDLLPPPQAAALRRALGLEAGTGGDRFLVSLALLGLLAETAETAPVLCLVDDAHWLDAASAEALAFVARRLEADAIAMLFAAREGEAREFEASSLPTMRLGGLDPASAAALLDRHSTVPLSPALRERLVEETDGNVLALIELSSTLSEAQLSGAEAVPAPLPVSARVEAGFLARVRRLPEDTQMLLLVASADDTGDLATVLAAAAELRIGADALDAAEVDGLVAVRGTELELRHPLVRSAVYQGATLSQRHAAHRALADVLDHDATADSRAWHLAAASVEPDPSVAEELERAAERAHQRSAYAAASLALERAAALTADGSSRVRRLVAAAENDWFAGRLERALMLLGRARPLTDQTVQVAEIDRWRGLIEINHGRPADAYAILARAANDVAPHNGERALDILNLAGAAAAYAGDVDAQVALSEMARSMAVDEGPFTRMLLGLLVGIGAHAAGDFDAAVPHLRDALALARELGEGAAASQPLALVLSARAALYLGDDESVYRSHRDAASRAREAGALGLLTQTLPILATTELWAGRWSSAAAHAREGVRLGREMGQHHLHAQALDLVALVAALRGDEDECRSLATESRELASARGLGFVREMTHWAIVLLELGLGRAAEALRHAREISTTLVLDWAALDRVEAAHRAGEPELARGWLDSFEPWAERTEAAWAAAVALHCRALLSGNELEAERLFRASLEAHAASSRPFERARTDLAFGEFLRRGRRRIEAREHLRAALEVFEALGAAAWAERARLELRASGQTARRRDPSTRDQLTPQELQIAHFVAEGLTNRQVAAQLFLSPRTIDFHLRNLFRKLGISSRTELARLDLGAAREEDPAIPPVRA